MPLSIVSVRSSSSSSHGSTRGGGEVSTSALESRSPVGTSIEPTYHITEPLDFFYVESVHPSRTMVVFPGCGDSGKVSGFASCMTMARVQRVAAEFNISPAIRLAVPRSGDRASTPPEGFVTVYEDCLRCGLRLPLPPVIAEFLSLYGISLGQVMPNSFKQLVALGVAAGRLGERLSLSLVIRFFQLKKSSGWFYLAPRLGFRAKTKSKIAKWQEKYFFCGAEEAGVPESPWRTEKLEDFEVEDSFGDVEEALVKLGQVDEAFAEADLVRVGLSPNDPAVKGEAPLRRRSIVLYFSSSNFF